MNCIGQTPNHALKCSPHYTNVGLTLRSLNDSDEDESDREDNKQRIAPLKTKYPKLLYFPDDENGSEEHQNVMKLVQDKAEFVTDVGKTATLCLRDGKS